MSEKINPRDIFGKTLVKLGELYSEIVVLDADLQGSTKTKEFMKKFPERYRNLGVSEQDMIGTAAGLALVGKKPYVCTFAIFATGRAWEQLRQSIAYQGLDVKIIGTHGGFVGEDGASHHGIEDIGLVRELPMVCVVPSIEEVEDILYVTAEDKNPTYIRLFRHSVEKKFDPKSLRFETGSTSLNDSQVKYIKPYKIFDGGDVTVVSNGYMLSVAYDVCKELRNIGIEPELISMPYVKPLDDELLLESVSKTKRWVSIEDHRREGGLGEALAGVLIEKYPVEGRIISIPSDEIIGSGNYRELYEQSDLDVKGIKETIYRFCKYK